MVESWFAGLQWAINWCTWLSGAFTGGVLFLLFVAVVWGLLGAVCFYLIGADKIKELQEKTKLSKAKEVVEKEKQNTD